MKRSFTFLSLLIIFSLNVFGQLKKKPLIDTYIIKTNILGLIPRLTFPTVSFEKILKNKMSLEASYINGALYDVYSYNGFLLRAKNYMKGLRYNEANVYLGTYLGTLKKDMNIGSSRESFIYIRPKNFKANSVRVGGTAGFAFVSKLRLIMDVQSSMGIGYFTKYYRRDPTLNKNAYFDFQLWGSIGYCF